MEKRAQGHYTAFAGGHKIAAGSLVEVALAVKNAVDRGESEAVLVFDDQTSQAVELDLRGTAGQVVERIAQPGALATAPPTGSEEGAPKRRRGRPKLGVVGREVTLLPRHWQWLGAQPGGASVTLRKLVEQARRANTDHDRRRLAQEATYRFTVAIAGNQPGFEEAMRGLFAGDAAKFYRHTESWPGDIREHASRLAGPSFNPEESS